MTFQSADLKSNIVESVSASYISFMESITEVLKMSHDGEQGESIATYIDLIHESVLNSQDFNDEWYAKIFSGKELSVGVDTLDQSSELITSGERFVRSTSIDPSIMSYTNVRASYDVLYLAYLDLHESVALVREHYRKSTLDALKIFSDSMRDNNEKNLSSLRDIYDVWVDKAEEAYYKSVMTLNFSKNFGDMINNTSAMHKALKAFKASIDDMLGSIGWRRFVDKESLLAQEGDKLQFLAEKLGSIKVNLRTSNGT